MNQTCPLCNHVGPKNLYTDSDRDYLRCSQCALIFVSRGDLLSPQAEKERYDLHENYPDDPRYRQFLGQLIEPLTQRIGPPPLQGLDYGSGPGPTLSVILEKLGYKMQIYDPFYAQEPAALSQTYDFVTCTETVEHFFHPGKEWNLLLNLVKPDGWLGFMTQLIDSVENFPEWYYINDLTHVCFFSRQTFRYLANQDGLSVEFINNNVILMQKRKDWIPPGSQSKKIGKSNN